MRGDVTVPAAVVLVDGVNQVVHAAAEYHVDRDVEGPGEFIPYERARHAGGVLEARVGDRGVPSCSYQPTRSTAKDTRLGVSADDAPTTEPVRRGKAAAELIARAYHVTFGVPVTIVRGAERVRAPPEPREGDPGVRDGRLDGHVPSPCTTRVSDVANGATSPTGHGHASWSSNAASREARTTWGTGTDSRTSSWRSASACSRGPTRRRIAFVDARPGHDFRYGLDDARLRALGWAPEVAFDEGLARTVAWLAITMDGRGDLHPGRG